MQYPPAMPLPITSALEHAAAASQQPALPPKAYLTLGTGSVAQDAEQQQLPAGVYFAGVSTRVDGPDTSNLLK